MENEFDKFSSLVSVRPSLRHDNILLRRRDEKVGKATAGTNEDLCTADLKCILFLGLEWSELLSGP